MVLVGFKVKRLFFFGVGDKSDGGHDFHIPGTFYSRKNCLLKVKIQILHFPSTSLRASQQ